MKNDLFTSKIDYTTLILFHVDRILRNINENGVTAIVETSVDALWATLTTELKKDKLSDWEEIDSRLITGKTEWERTMQGKQRVLDKLQLIMDILGEHGMLYRSIYEEVIGEEVKIYEEEEEVED